MLTIREQIDVLESEIGKILGRNSAGTVKRPGRPPGSKTSAAGRARIASAQRARWAKMKKVGASPGAAKKVRRKMSAAGLAKIAAAAKARWEKAKAAGKNRL